MTRRLKFIISCLLIFSLCGCEAFVRKFTRKPKQEQPKETLVLVPEEYKVRPMSEEELYRQYFLFWKSWQDELINSLSANSNHKKVVVCAEEAVKNLKELSALLNREKRKELQGYISQLSTLRDAVASDIYGHNANRNKVTAENLKRNILRDFSYKRVKNSLT